ncbi:protein kinase-like protein [Striga asiatica]|uniref:non-specific serine/threonine protein kinase n=1 Tax=Striga asiatica TaxID=4170 RepID=A0A5A7RAD4_STRAF|nr:protein kinase-like protein [Striga asiatica]
MGPKKRGNSSRSPASTPSKIQFDVVNARPGLPDISLDVQNATPEVYNSFIKKFSLPGNDGHGILTPRFVTSRGKKCFQRRDLPGKKAYFDIYLSAGAHRLGCRFLRSSLYLFAFRPTNGPHWYAMDDWYDNDNFQCRNWENLGMENIDGMSVEYRNMEKRDNMPPCKQMMSWTLVICQMIPEAARIPAIREALVAIFESGGQLNRELALSENDFFKMSRNIIGHSIVERLNNIQMDRGVLESLSIIKESKIVEYQSTIENEYQVSALYCTIRNANILLITPLPNPEHQDQELPSNKRCGVANFCGVYTYVACSGSQSPGIGSSSPALRGMCISQAAEMAAVKRLLRDIGTVNLAELISTNCVFAIKVMDSVFLGKRIKIGRAQTEMEIMCSLLQTIYHAWLWSSVHALRQKQPGRYFHEQAARYGWYITRITSELYALCFVGEGTFGVLLYELLYGRTPYKGSCNENTLANVVLKSLRSPITGAGAGAGAGAAETKKHPFFEGLNWALIRCGVPPQVPEFCRAEVSEKGERFVDCGGNDHESHVFSCFKLTAV